MRGFIDLHSHWVAGIDDGVKTPADGIALLRGLHAAGFSTVVATPHMRPGMFENDRAALESAFAAMTPHLDAARASGTGGPLPEVHLASEHFFDEVVFDRLKRGLGLPYPSLLPSPETAASASGGPGPAPRKTGRSVLVEFPPTHFPAFVQARFFDLKRAQLTPVLAHPERYQPVWRDDSCLNPILDSGAHLLLDVGSLIGKYGRAAQRASEKLLEEEAYEAACSDAHKPEDAEWVVRAIARLEELVGKEESVRLLSDGPRNIMNAGAARNA
jgi:protein-tyrosine phosphatase